MKYVDIRDLPPCAFSPQCLRLLDDLDSPPTAYTPTRLSYIEDLQDERRLRQLRSHVSGCSTCSALLAEARHMRTQQRTTLHQFLLANEQRVPSTTQAIFVALHREQAQQEEERKRAQRAYVRMKAFSSTRKQDEALGILPSALHARAVQPRSLLQNVLTLATVVAVILAAFGLLNRAANPSASPANAPTSPPHPESVPGSDGWNSVVIGVTLISATGLVSRFSIYSLNTVSGQMETLPIVSQEGSDAQLEEVSKDGQSLLYESPSADQQMSYTAFSPASGAHTFYTLAAQQAGNALWMDADHVLVQNTQGTVLALDVHSAALQQAQHTWPLATARLLFYHSPFLYYTSAQGQTGQALYRLNLVESGAVPQQVTEPLLKARFWLSPSGKTVFYTNGGQNGTLGVYAVGSDGTHRRILRNGPGIPIGYGANDELMLLQQMGQKLQVIKLDATAQQKDQVVLADAAPSASSLCGPASVVVVIALCDQNIALSPYGHGLLLHAYYANGTHNLIYDDLTTGTSRKFNLPDNATVQLPGWSRMTSTGTATTSTPTAKSQIKVVSPFSGLAGLVMASRTATPASVCA